MKEFIKLINSYLDKEIDYDKFYLEFNNVYFGEGSGERNKELSNKEGEFLDNINEKMFFAAKDPSMEEKQKYNYIDADQFLEWLKQEKEDYVDLWEKYEVAK